MEQVLDFCTRTASLAVFDPEILVDRSGDEDWWCVDDFSTLDEVKTGKIAIMSLGSNRWYQVKVSDQEFSQDEMDYATFAVENLGVEVVSGKLFVGPAECLPGFGAFDSAVAQERGLIFDMPNDTYFLDGVGIFFCAAKKFFKPNMTDENLDISPSDFALKLRPRSGPIPDIEKEPVLWGHMGKNLSPWVFDSQTRDVGPAPGMIITTDVFQKDGKWQLEICGPGYYTPTANHELLFDAGQQVKIKVLEVDHANWNMSVEVVEK